MSLSAYGFSLEDRGMGAEQQGYVQAFKRLLQKTGAWDERIFDDHDCARFLKARNYDFQAAKQMWDNMLAWRRENRVDTIRDWFVFYERKEYDLVFPTGLHKTDKEGHPVLIQQLGRVNIGALYKVTTDERIRLAHIAENEHLRRVVFPSCSRAASRPIDQLFTIIDLEGVAFTSMMRTTSLLKMFMTMDSNNYPETLARMAIINAPGWFSTSWGAVKSVLSGDTVRKIEILGKDYQAALLRYISRENLLEEYGGLSRGHVTQNEGPWQKQVQEMEELPERPASPLPLPASVAFTTASELVQTTSGRMVVATTASVAMAGMLLDAPAPGGSGAGKLELSGSGGGATDQRILRDATPWRPQSPVRSGAKGALLPGNNHLAPQACLPLPKGHVQPYSVTRAPGQSGTGLEPSSSSPASSPSDSTSDSTHNMTAPLLSNFLSTSESTSPQQQMHHHQQSQRHATQYHQQNHKYESAPPAGISSPQGSAGGAPATAAPLLPPPRRSTGGGGLVAGIVATFQAAVGHVGAHHAHLPQQLHTAAAVSDSSILRPPAGPSAPAIPHGAVAAPQPHLLQQQPQQPQIGMSSSSAAGPAQLLINSPREDATGPGTVCSAVSDVYSPPSMTSPLSPTEMQALTDTATSRRTEGGASNLGGSAMLVPGGVAAGTPAVARHSGGGISAGGVAAIMPSFAGGGVSTFASAVMTSTELMPGGLPTSALPPPPMPLVSPTVLVHQHSPAQLLLPPPSPPPLQLQQQSSQDTEDVESVRMSVMSQRSFYSAMSHLDQSSSSGVTSPNEASDNARRWSMQRDLHAAAIASALAATAERRAAVTAAAASTASAAAARTGSGVPVTAIGCGTSGKGTMHTVAAPSAAALSGVSYIGPPAAQQSLGSYMEQPPSYGAVRSVDGLGSFTAGGQSLAPRTEDGPDVGSSAGCGLVTNGLPVGSHRHNGVTHQTLDTVVIQIGSDSNGGSGMSRSPSAATMEECSLGAGAVRWARGWFFRRRNYGRLVDGDSMNEGMGNVGAGQGSDGARQGGTMLVARGGKGGHLGTGPYASMLDGPESTSPSKLMPKMVSIPHHVRGDSWERDQPSPYDIDQTHGRGGGGGAGGGVHRDTSFRRGGERRRLLRSESPGCRRNTVVGEHCGCLPCCNVM